MGHSLVAVKARKQGEAKQGIDNQEMCVTAVYLVKNADCCENGAEVRQCRSKCHKNQTDQGWELNNTKRFTATTLVTPQTNTAVLICRTDWCN
mmetsp:Transcript_42793/g.76873  ORF Transcript_42793/g.76873 Transcript_42793/m.76873 type:complete len:93 (+) Transcript_42793:1-279(+)